MTTTKTSRNARIDRAVAAQPITRAECLSEANELPAATANFGLVGWMIWMVPVALYLAWIAFSTDHSVDWLRVVLHALLIGLAGLVFAEWLAFRMAMGGPEMGFYHLQTHALSTHPDTGGTARTSAQPTPSISDAVAAPEAG